MTSDTDVSRRGECPACGMPVPYLKTHWRLGTPFACRQCGSELVIDKTTPLATTAFYVPFSIWARTIGFLIPIGMLAIASLLTWQFSTVRLLKRAD